MTSRIQALMLVLMSASLAGACGIGNTQTDLRSAVDAERPALDACYAAALERDPSISGDLALMLRIERKTSTVAEAEVVESDLGDDALGTCVADALRGTTIEARPGRPVHVRYTLSFTQGDG